MKNRKTSSMSKITIKNLHAKSSNNHRKDLCEKPDTIK